MTDTRKVAKQLIDKGIRPIPIPRGEKLPLDKGWPKREWKAKDFRPTDNIGIHLGPSGLVDVDLDVLEAILAAPHLLPETFLHHGRPSKPDSHWWYKTSVKGRKFLDPEKVNGKAILLLEIRAGEGWQTVIPPSRYNMDGKIEELTWTQRGKPATVDGKELEKAVARVAAAALLARHWPGEGARQDAALALAGALLRAGQPLPSVQELIRAVCAGAKDDETEKRVDTVQRTQEKLNAGQAVSGVPSLQQLMPREVVSKALDWLNIGAVATPKDDEDQDEATEVAPVPAFPLGALNGLAGDFARAYSRNRETPASFLGLTFLAYLGHVVSGRVTMAGDYDPRLYLALLGVSGRSKKSTALQTTHRFWGWAWPNTKETVLHGVGSGEGVAQAIQQRGGHMLDLLDELRLLTDKAKQEGSTLLALFSRLFEGYEWSNSTVGKNSKPIFLTDAHLSLVGASTLGTFGLMWSEHFLNLGFMNRLFYVVDDSSKRIANPEDPAAEIVVPLVERTHKLCSHILSGDQIVLRMTKEAEDLFRVWYAKLPDDDCATRLDTYAKRLMILLAVCDDERKGNLDYISEANVDSALALADYQYVVRKRYAPVEVETRSARLENSIRRDLAGRPNKRARWRDLYRAVSGHRFGAGMFAAVIGHMADAGFLRVEHGAGKQSRVVELSA